MDRGSVIIPTLNEERTIARAIDSVRPTGAEVIVADGGSADRTVDAAREAGACVVVSARGRGVQLAAGAAAASGSWFLFLHADCSLSDRAHVVLAAALADPAFQAGTFRLRLDRGHPLYRLYGWFTRFDSVWTSFGDQGLVIRRGLYESLGGFPEWSLLEDVELLRRVRSRTPIRSLPAEMETSVRRFERNGIVRQQVLNLTILIRYLLGADPERLARIYEAPRR